MNKTGAFDKYHPLPLFLYFIYIFVITIFTLNPVLMILAFLGGVCFCTVLESAKAFLHNILFYFPFFILLSITNPLFSHGGVTPLFFINGNAFTLEALLYGVNMSLMIISVMYWCKCYQKIITEDKFLYLFGKAAPKLSLVISMAIRLIPLFKKQIKRISNAQKAMGLYSSKSYADKLKSGVRVFSSLVTWSLENAVETSNSMKSRGFGLKNRSSFSLYKFHKNDLFFLSVSTMLFLIVVCFISVGCVKFAFYPKVTTLSFGIKEIMIYISFGMLCFMPFILEVKEKIKWKYLLQRM